MLDDTQLEALKQKHGKVHQLTLDEDSVVVRIPHRMEFRKWHADVNDDRKKLDASESLLVQCIVYPDAAAVEAMLNARPGLATTWAGDLLELAGLSKSSEKKAL